MSKELERIKIVPNRIEEQLEKIISENKRLRFQYASATKQVNELNEFMQIMLNMSPVGISIIQNDRFIFNNKAFSEIVGFSQKKLRNMAPEDIVFEADREHVTKSIEGAYTDHVQTFFMFRIMTKDEKIKWILGSVALIHMNEKQALLGNFVDLTEGRVMHLAYNDALTGLPNRKLMMDRMEQAIVAAKRRNEKLALLFMDLDGFKNVNDQYGHEIGDKLLIEIAGKLREVVRRENDTISRFGGDEFLILLTDIIHRDHIESIIFHLFDKFTKPISIAGTNVTNRVCFSVGVALYPEHGEDSDTLIRHADEAMYRIKKTRGKNSFLFFEPS